ncbi:MAG TPA: M24 family metallopeptidase [Gaiellaceae bacterium]|nr:M24 family metallopeptidase [Gaiellaceae bacterium]
MPDVLIVADTRSSPELRHEVPLLVPDPFLYAEAGGRKRVAVGSLEASRIAALGLEVTAFDELGADELVRAGLSDEALANELHLRACRAFGLERALVPAGFPTGTADFLRAAGIELAVDPAHFRDRRRVKTEAELAGIRRAQRAAEAALAAVRGVLARAEARNGSLVVDGETVTCELLKRHVDEAFAVHGASAEESIVSHGPQTAVGHDPGSGPVAPGEPILLDLFPVDRASACYADLTRVFVVGEVPAEIREYHRLVREALELASAEVRPGVNGRDIHRRVCDFFHEHGYPTQLHKEEGQVLEDGFFHGTGHGVGLAVHEAPSLGRVGHELVAGDVVTIEPGLYRSGFGGVRLEDLLLVTDDGYELLTDFPYDLEVQTAP